MAFHNCLRYADGTEGCDSCLNWDGVETALDDPAQLKRYGDVHQTNNNGLGPLVIPLEDIYRTACSNGPPCLGQSLFDSGKSRADLWAFAAIVAVEYGMETNNVACNNTLDSRVIPQTCVQEPGPDCKIQPLQTFQFLFGRVDWIGNDVCIQNKQD